MPTWGEARVAAIERLGLGADPRTAVLDADVLLAFVLGLRKEDVIAHPGRPLADPELSRFRTIVERRARGEPVAYLRGFKEFYGLRFAVDPRVLIPRPETEALVDAAREFIAARPLVVVDVGTGCGAIAIAIAAHERTVHVIATDVSRDALEVAEENALSHGVADRVDFRAGDLLGPVTERVEVVCANLPYLPDDALARLAGERSSLAFEPRAAVVAGGDGLDVIRRAVAQLPRVLAPGGAAFFECDPPQAADIERLLTDIGLRTRVVRDLTGAERVISSFA
jgi:release factor glutamine methyltransferase